MHKCSFKLVEAFPIVPRLKGGIVYRFRCRGCSVHYTIGKATFWGRVF